MPTTIIDVDKINWKKKDLDSPETQNTNSILIHNSSDDNETSRNIQLQQNYNFSRKEHFSFKAEKQSYMT